jgi:hypothetical protein
LEEQPKIEKLLMFQRGTPIPIVLEIAGLRVPSQYIETLLWSMSVPQVKIVPPLDALQLLMLFAGALTYSELKLFSLNHIL